MNDILQKLSATIKLRKQVSSTDSYSASLLNAGPERCAQKFGEEAIELIIAATGSDLKAFNNEAADLIFHFLVLIEAKNADFNEILGELQRRQLMSGHAEKASRKS